ncbi:MAG: hypothetical protein AAGF87_05005 [Bacteroidota bacterium]
MLFVLSTVVVYIFPPSDTCFRLFLTIAIKKPPDVYAGIVDRTGQPAFELVLFRRR